MKMCFHTVWMLSVATLVSVYQFSDGVNGLKIGSFNIQVFGESKSKKTDVMDVLAKIVLRYDILLIMEIRDSKKKAMPRLLDLVQPLDGEGKYEIHYGSRLGRSNSKEQYAFLYRNNLGLEVVDVFDFDDTKDRFEREPYVIHFKSPNTEVEDFVLIGIHVDPDVAVSEINELEDVYDNVRGRTRVHNIIIMGDLNADCSYVSKKAMKKINLRHRSDLYWPIDDDADTTSGRTQCAYDRFIIGGEKLIDNIVPGSVQIFNYQEEYGLNDELTKKVSDHYPIELEIKDIQDIQDISKSTRNKPSYTMALSTVVLLVMSIHI